MSNDTTLLDKMIQGPAGPTGPQGPTGPSGGGSYCMAGMCWVDPAFTGTANGSESAPYTSVANALAGTSGDLTIKLAPGDHDEASIAIPFGRKISFVANGQRARITEQIVWTYKNSNQLNFTQVDVPSGISTADGDSGTGEVLLYAADCRIGNIVNGNSGGATQTHRLNITSGCKTIGLADVSSGNPGASFNSISLRGDLNVNDTAVNGAVTHCRSLLARDSYLGGNVTVTDNSIIYTTEISPSITLTFANPGTQLFVDAFSNYQVKHATVSGSITKVIIADITA